MKHLLFAALVLFLSSCRPFYEFIHISPSSKLKTISFSRELPNPQFEFYYSDTTNHEYLRTLRQQYRLDSLVSREKNEMDSIKAILAWTNRQWSHNGSNNPSNADALTILKEAAQGNMYRCVEYGIVGASALTAIGIPARVLGLKSRDVEVVSRGAGHVVAEVYLRSAAKWVFMDPQFDIIPYSGSNPLNAVEFQQAILNRDSALHLENKAGVVTLTEATQYISWVGKYLYFFDALFDQRISAELKLKRINGMTKLTLVPEGVKEPKVFQRKYPINYSLYSHSLLDFYRIPKTE